MTEPLHTTTVGGHRGVGDKESRTERAQRSALGVREAGPGREGNTAVMFRLRKISSNIHLVSHRLISRGAKRNSLGFSPGRLTLWLRMAHRLSHMGAQEDISRGTEKLRLSELANRNI